MNVFSFRPVAGWRWLARYRGGWGTVGLAIAVLLISSRDLRAGPTNDPLDFKEVFELLRAQLRGVSEVELNQAATKGLLTQLEGQVTLVTEEPPATDEAPSPALAQSAVFDKVYGYFRVGRVVSGLEDALSAALRQLTATNRLQGLVIDLRFAGGDDYAAAAAAADVFIASEQPLLDWGDGIKKSTAKENTPKWPVAVLVNRKTSRAAEALAGIFRHAEVGLILGASTAGQASLAKEFTLKTGQRLRLATTPIKFADGKPLPAGGLKPDILVEVDPDDERAHFADAYRMVGKPPSLGAGAASIPSPPGATNPSPRRRLNEAELVRMSREGQTPDADTNAAARRAAESDLPGITDPALARALDLLKGLAVVQKFRSI